jgi:hypothetical protein
MDSQIKKGRLALLVGAIVICALGTYLNRAYFSDDAFITLRYAYNFIHGDGICWNPGERVEGNTNFLFLVTVSGLGAMGVDLVTASRIVNFSAFISLLAFVAFYFRRVRRREPAEGQGVPESAAFALVLANFPMIVWCWGGMETPVYTLFCTIGIWTFSEAMGSGFKGQQLVLSAVAFALACMLRPDGMLFPFLSSVFLVGSTWRQVGVLVKRILLFVVPFSSIFVPYFLWRFNYYGLLLPNTYYVKAADLDLGMLSCGMLYLLKYSISPPFLLPVLVAAMVYARKEWSRDRRIAYLGCAVFLYLLYVVLVGGDHLTTFRFILPVIPSAILLLYLAVGRYMDQLDGRRGLVVCLVTLYCISLQIVWPLVNVRSMHDVAFVGRIVGKYIATEWPEGSLVALNAAGATPYYAPRHRYIDMLGLNDAHIAHRRIRSRQLEKQWLPGHLKGDGAYVLSRAPDYIIVGPPLGRAIDDPWFLSDLEMGQDPRFEQNYERVRVDVDAKPFKGYEDYECTRSGTLEFTYYERKQLLRGAESGP